MSAVSNVSRSDQRRASSFRRLVGSIGDRLDVGGVGIQHIRPEYHSGHYEPDDEAPHTALIIAARSLPIGHFRGPISSAIDLIAYLPDTREIFRRCGTVDVLGEWWCRYPMDRTIIYPDPAAWCRANGAGLCILDWTNLREVLGGMPGLVAPNVEIARRLRDALRPGKIRRPEIFVADMA